MRKSTTCFGKATGKPVSEYDSHGEAEESARYARNAYGRDLVPYRCGTCALWHLSPNDRQTRSSECWNCRGADGRSKQTYESLDDAERRAEILLAEQGVQLRAYQCEYGGGRHLTKKLNSW